MNDDRPGAAPNYTTAALTMMAINLIWVFGLLWAIFGFVPVLFVALALHHGIDRLSARGNAG
jgi:hypothetical protein